ncbi:MAG: hypothetical protein ABI408_05595 [Gemmatimonadaceae bacterium]
MIRHQIYFDTLGSMREDSASWRCVFAGLSVLRLVDSYADATAAAKPAGWAQLHSVRAAIEEMSDGDAMRGVLTAVLEEVTKNGAIDDTVCGALLAYGRALDYEASWSLAIDVYSTVAKFVKPERNARLAVEANVAIGGAARRNGDWDTSARAYSQAAYIADTLGDRPGVLTVQVGIANTYLAKGNLPQAQTILDDVIVQARDQHFRSVHSIALHSRAAIAQRQGEPAEGLKLLNDALNLTTKPAERDQVLEDIGGMFTELGMYESARDAHLILASTAQAKVVRWTATLNLMELASLERMEKPFDAYAEELRTAPVGPWIKSHYLLFLGEGLIRFGRIDTATDVLAEAVSFADANQFHQVSFKAQQALVESRSKPSVRTTFVAPPARSTGEIGPVVQAISDLRKSAVAAT